MDKMSLLSVLVVSIPEQLLMLITVILMVGRKDLLKLTLGNLFKLSFITLSVTLFVVSLRYILHFMVLNTSLYLLFTLLMYILILKLRWHECLVATLIVFLEFAAIEVVIISFAVGVLHIHPDYILSNDWMRIKISFPIRLLDILIIVLLFKLPMIIIDLKPLRRTTDFVKEFYILALCLFFGLLLIVNIINFIMFDFRILRSPGILSYLVTNIFFTIMFIVTTLITVSKFKKTYEKEKNESLHTFLYIKSLLNSDEYDIIKLRDIINNEISRVGGKYDER